MQTSEHQLPFLDVMVIRINTPISIDIYFRSTDSKQYLDFKPCHPKHTKVNIPFSLARRICTIVSDISIRNVRLKELDSSLIDRKYPIQVVKPGFLKALQIPRSSLLTVKEETGKPIIPFISIHNPKNRGMFGLLKSNFTILKQDEKMNKIITETKFIKCKRQPPNLKRIITRSEFKEETTAYVKKCGESRSGLCDYIVGGNSINLNNKFFLCKRKYGLHSKKCNLCLNL